MTGPRGMFGVAGSGDTSGYGRLVGTVTAPESSPRPYGGYFDDVVDRLAVVLADEFDAAVERVVVHRDQLTLEISRADGGACRRRACKGDRPRSTPPP